MAIGIGQAASRIKKFFTADQLVSRSGFKLNDVYYHNDDRVPIGRIGDNTHVWHYENSPDGAMVAGSNQKVGWRDVAEPIRHLRSRGRYNPIMIVTGTHGAADGGNWAIDGRWCIRYSKSLEMQFYMEDIVFSRNVAQGIDIIDISMLDDIKFHHLLNHSGYDVIMAHCYSRNDSALRYFLNLQPVTSFVTPLDFEFYYQNRINYPVFFPNPYSVFNM